VAQNKKFTFGPLFLTNTYTTNVLNPPTASGGVNGGSSSQYVLIYQIRVINKTGGAVTFRLFKDATGGNTAGKEIAYDRSVAANDEEPLHFPTGLRFDAADFLVGGASAANSLIIMGEGEIGVAG
jgi:hypothetical protein